MNRGIYTKSNKDFLDEIKATEELIKRGYKKKKCDTCNGGINYLDCWRCFGKGYYWIGPMR